MERFLDMHMYITSALQKTDMKAVGLQLALELLHEKVTSFTTIFSMNLEPSNPSSFHKLEYYLIPHENHLFPEAYHIFSMRSILHHPTLDYYCTHHQVGDQFLLLTFSLN